MRTTIGLPVYQAAATVGDCLACVLGQSARDLRVVLSDNASTDATAEIADAVAARDPRLQVIRRPRNVGALANFAATLDAADTPYFLWRADDDLSAPDYVETLVGLLEATPEAYLAVGVTIRDVNGKPEHATTITPPVSLPTARAARIDALIAAVHPTWFYGVWRTAALRACFARMRAEFGAIWASDHALLMAPILDAAVATTDATRFIQRVGYHRPADNFQTRQKLSVQIERRGAARLKLPGFWRDEVARRVPDAPERRRLAARAEELATLWSGGISRTRLLRWRLRHALLGDR